MDESLRFVPESSYAIEKELKGDSTYFNWKAAFDECKVNGASGVKSQLHAFMCSIEQCNGAGDCRKSNLFGGVMCPAFKVSSEETDTTRARSNVLREILTRGWNSEAFNDSAHPGSIFESSDLKTVLDSCLACKGCKRECPSNVDMTRLRAEVLQHIYDKSGMPIRTHLISRMAEIEKLGSFVRPIYNAFVGCNATAAILRRILHFSAERNLPRLSANTMCKLVSRMTGPVKPNGRKVLLFADEFTNYQEAELGLKFAELLVGLGYVVEIPKHVESGRASISKGNLRHARKCAKKNLALLKDCVTEETPLVGIEPSCILSFRDEYPDLVSPENRNVAIELAKNCLLYDEFLCREIDAGRISSDMFSDRLIEIWLHGHCHQKSLIGVDKTVKAFGLLKNAKVNVIPSGCCGMAGSFGYEKEHYKTSLAIGEMILFPTVRKVAEQNKGTIPMFVAAPGTSCRQQIKDGTGITVVHPIEILYSSMNNIIS